jgi:hypothetical protein
MTGVVSAAALSVLMTLSVSVRAAEEIPFTVCKESSTWTRPTANVQAKIWNDSRYAGLKPETLWEWNHDFIMVPSDSASIPYHMANTSGLWTEGVFSPACTNDRKNTDWIAVWVLLHRVRSVEIVGSTYTIRADPAAKGFQSILIKRVSPVATIRFVDANGKVIDTIGDGR